MRRRLYSSLILGLIPYAMTTISPAAAATAPVSVEIHSVDTSGVHSSLGTISLSDSDDGLVLTPRLKGLPPGPHGFHVHENPDCSAKEKDGKMTAAQAAGGHFDPAKAGKHLGPQGAGHKGDLPALEVAADGSATKPVTAPHLKVQDLAGRSLMIHAGGDNYSDTPQPLGGGGARIACGVVAVH